MNRNTEQQIDHILNALGSARPSEGLEGRVAQRLAEAAEARASSPSVFASAGRALKDSRFVQPRPAIYALAAIATAAVLVGLHHERAHSFSEAAASFPAQSNTADISVRSHQTLPAATLPGPSIPTNFKPRQVARVSPINVSEALALEETRAPRLLAPALPLTQQERLLRRATRSGGFTELAQLEPAREAELHSALLAHQRHEVDRYIERMLRPLAAAEALNHTPAADSSPAPAEAEATPN